MPVSRPPDGLADLTAAVDDLAAPELDRLPAVVGVERVLAWRRRLDRQQGLWLEDLAEVDARGAAGAEKGRGSPLHRFLAAQPPAHGRRCRP